LWYFDILRLSFLASSYSTTGQGFCLEVSIAEVDIQEQNTFISLVKIGEGRIQSIYPIIEPLTVHIFWWQPSLKKSDK
jgi:hypothetical protein